MPDPGASDSLLSLVQATRDCSPEAAESLLRQLYPALSQYARRRLSGLADAHDVADDVTQEAMIRIARSLHQTHATTDTQLIAWALSVLRNVIHDYYRIHPPEDEPLRLTAENEAGILGALTRLSAPAGEPQPRNRSVLVQLVREVCRALPAQAAYLIHLRLEQHAIWEEIATELGTTPAGAKRRFQRLQLTLRKQIISRIERMSPPDRDASRRRLRLDRP